MIILKCNGGGKRERRETGGGMGRPRQFDKEAVLDATIHCFWSRGYEATSIQDLVGETGITAASLYNAYGDKRSIFRAALGRYVEAGVGERMRRCEALPPRQAIRALFDEILTSSVNDRERKGCMLVNSALEIAPHDAELRKMIAGALDRIESFFLRCLEKGQAEGVITRRAPAKILARHLLGVLVGLRVLARVRAERALLEAVIAPALASLDALRADD
jgi:TetR/AcrR family transcriptional repressor of nem operon